MAERVIPIGDMSVYQEVAAEAARAVELQGNNSMRGFAMNSSDKYAVLGAEYGEVGQAVVQKILGGIFVKGREHHKEDLRKELLQVAGVAVNWVLALDQFGDED